MLQHQKLANKKVSISGKFARGFCFFGYRGLKFEGFGQVLGGLPHVSDEGLATPMVR